MRVCVWSNVREGACAHDCVAQTTFVLHIWCNGKLCYYQEMYDMTCKERGCGRTSSFSGEPYWCESVHPWQSSVNVMVHFESY